MQPRSSSWLNLGRKLKQVREMGKGVGVRRDQLKEIQHPWGDFSMRDRTG